jgi:glycosyltransferase involved in cell wall biosynthesis
MNLLILNYSMNPNSLVFSHQRVVAERLAPNFEKTFVVTSDNNLREDQVDLIIKSTNWQVGKMFRNIFSVYRLILPIVFTHRGNLVIFSHMTEVQSFLIAPICRILGIPHFLWYAHKSKSPYLTFSFPFLTGIITSTPGSCPISGPKIHPIGQAIDQKVFNTSRLPSQNPPLRWYHIGRMDKSKNIDLIIDVFKQLRKTGWRVTLDLFGDSSSESSRPYLTKLSQTYFIPENSNWLTFHGALQRSKIPDIAQRYDGFVHAFQGSLDKAVLEAAMCKRIVVSTNPEFESEFGCTDLSSLSAFDKLYSLIVSSLEMPAQEQKKLIRCQFDKTIRDHSLDNWISKLMTVITN